MTDAEIEALWDDMDAQRDDIREALAEALGGDPEDYSAERYFADESSRRSGEVAPDGGEE